jgi:hypothetical protein
LRWRGGDPQKPLPEPTAPWAPAPIIDHGSGRERAFKAYAAIRAKRVYRVIGFTHRGIQLSLRLRQTFWGISMDDEQPVPSPTPEPTLAAPPPPMAAKPAVKKKKKAAKKAAAKKAAPKKAKKAKKAAKKAAAKKSAKKAVKKAAKKKKKAKR